MDHYLKPILEHKILIIVTTAVMALLGVAASLVIPPSYRSTASVLLTPISGNPLTPLESDTDVDMATELLIATSKAVVGRVADDLAVQSIDVDVDQLADDVSASSPRESKVLELTYRASTPERAQLITDSFAENYLEYREQIASENRAEAVDLLNDRIALLKDQLSQIEGRLSQMEEGTQPYVSASVERDSVDGELQAQQEALAALSTLSLSAGEILSPARVPVAPSGPGLIALLAGGLTGGLVVGIVGAMLLSAVQASRAPRNRRASDHIEQNRRQEDRFQIGGRRAGDRQSESAVEKLARVTAGREEAESRGEDADSDEEIGADQPLESSSDEDLSDEELSDATADDTADLSGATADDTTADLSDSAEVSAPVPEWAVDNGSHKTTELANLVMAMELAADEAAAMRPVVHQGAPPLPPAGPPVPRMPDQPMSTLTSPADAAAHFGDGVPPPPRNKAKMKTGSKPPSTDAIGDRSANRHTPLRPPSIERSNLEVEPDFDRLIDEIRDRLTVGAVACVAVGQDSRAQSVAAGFALVDGLKGLGVDVLIVDAVLDEPVLSDVLELPNIPGLSELMVGQASLETAVQQLEGFNGLYVVTAGDATPLTRSAFGTPKLGELLHQTKQRFPVVVVIGGDLTDAAVLSGADGELDGLLAATTAPPGQPAGSDLVGALSILDTSFRARISIAGDAASTSTAATAPTTV